MTSATAGRTAPDTGLLPRLRPPWLSGYQRSWLSADLVAGVTLAAVAIPEVMGYTAISQTPVVTGLYTVIFPPLLFALLGSKRITLAVAGADPAFVQLLDTYGLRRRDGRIIWFTDLSEAMQRWKSAVVAADGQKGSGR